jgi:DmsE family decaheme c-type cytochrome
MRLNAFLAALTGAVVFGLTTQFASAQTPPATTPAADIPCTACHEAYVTSFLNGPHAVKGAKGTPAALGADCAACHGDVSEHLKDPTAAKPPISFKHGPGTAQAESESCLKCHGGNRKLTFWDAGKHRINDVTCSACHSVHGVVGAGQNVGFKTTGPKISPFVTSQRQMEYETCNACHNSVRNQILKASHHPIVEGKVTCSDCHNPHGALSHKMLKNESVTDQCMSCHAEKRGPYLYEHPAVVAGCNSCHQPHGSVHNFLLNEKVPNLCQDCHDWSRHPGTIYQGNNAWPPQGNANTRFIARACLNCHGQIHGSNAPGNRGKFFLR